MSEQIYFESYNGESPEKLQLVVDEKLRRFEGFEFVGLSGLEAIKLKKLFEGDYDVSSRGYDGVFNLTISRGVQNA